MYTTHELRLIRTEKSGLEEWDCPTCGRTIRLRWPPDYEKQVVERGDARACHIASSAAVRGGHSDTGAPSPVQDTGRQWHDAQRWLRETGLDALPTAASLNRSEPV